MHHLRIPALTLALASLVLAGCISLNPAATSPADDAPASVTPFLMFQDGRAEEATHFYVEAFGDARVIEIDRFPDGSIMTARFELRGQHVIASDSPIKHDFEFTPAVSMFVDCRSEDDQNALFTALAEGGEVFMPLDNYGFSQRFGWVADRFGISWQLNLPNEEDASH